MPWYCPTCSGRTYWCYWCKVRHCAHSPHISRAKKYDRQVVLIKTSKGTRTMAARRYAHLKGAQKGGQKTAQGPNMGRFNPDTARKAALARWLGRHKVNKRIGVRLGLPSKKQAPGVSRAHLRYLYSRAPRLGIRFVRLTQEWVQMGDSWIRVISEQTALRRLGHLKYARKNWVPGENEPIIARTRGTFGIPRARRGSRRTSI